MLTAGIMDALDIGKAHIVGHDWGSALAWVFAALYPDRTLQLVAMSVGNPNGYFKGDHANEQKQKSWYPCRPMPCACIPCTSLLSVKKHPIAQAANRFCCKPAC